MNMLYVQEELSYEEVRRKTRPKNAYEGMTSGLATAAAGVAAGVAGLVVAPMMGAKQDGAAGFAKGMVAGELLLAQRLLWTCACPTLPSYRVMVRSWLLHSA